MITTKHTTKLINELSGLNIRLSSALIRLDNEAGVMSSYDYAEFLSLLSRYRGLLKDIMDYEKGTYKG